MIEGRANLLGLTSSEIEATIAPHVDRSFRARQVAQWIHQREARGFAEMTNLPVTLREALAGLFEIREPDVVETVSSADGSIKSLFSLADGAAVEAVSMPETDTKATFCLSSQAGCGVGCTFCVTGALGPGRNLSPGEIVGQYRVLRRALPESVERVNLVFMGMGEPLLNRRHLDQALQILYERVSPKRITVSTSGIIPGIHWLGKLPRRPKLALSLNAPDQARREKIMPITRRYPLDDLMEAIREFPLERGRRITFEYVLIAGFNDQPADAKMMVRLIHGVPSKVNLIPLNEDPVHFPDLSRPSEEVVNGFARVLRDAGITVTVRWSKGADVAAACGQLKGRIVPQGKAAAQRDQHPS